MRKGGKEIRPVPHGGGQPLSLRDAMNRLFDESFLDPFEDMNRFMSAPRGASFPKVDISEDEKEITVRADVPGVDPDDIDIEIEGDHFSISGKTEKESEEKDEEKKYYCYERQYGEFRRGFVLPSRVQEDKVSAKVKDGVLTVVLPKEEKEKSRKVKVKKD